MLLYDLINEAGQSLEPPSRGGSESGAGISSSSGAPGRQHVLVLRVLAPLRNRTAGQLLVRSVIDA